jgi:hypothetical protein
MILNIVAGLFPIFKNIISPNGEKEQSRVTQNTY